jgi:hypothetical protein
LKIKILRVVTSYNFADRYQCFGCVCELPLQVRKLRRGRKNDSLTVKFLVCRLFNLQLCEVNTIKERNTKLRKDKNSQKVLALAPTAETRTASVTGKSRAIKKVKLSLCIIKHCAMKTNGNPSILDFGTSQK